MGISLKNHEDRITRLEQNVGSSTGDTGWINGSRNSNFNYNHESLYLGKILRYRVKNGICYLQLSGYANTASVLGKFDNWNYGELMFMGAGNGNRGGWYEGKCIKIDSSGNVINATAKGQDTVHIFLSSSCPLNKYYLLRELSLMIGGDLSCLYH